MVVDVRVWLAAHLAAGGQVGAPTLLLAEGADAIYIATADYLNIPLVTWDREQHNRAARRITVWTP